MLKCILSIKSQRAEFLSSRFHRGTRRIHAAQKILLDTIFYIYMGLPSSVHSSRTYRQLLPVEDQRELEDTFSENILFAAKVISHGFRILGIEAYTEVLQEPARQLCAALEALRHVFRSRALSDPRPPYLDMIPVMKVFNKSLIFFIIFHLFWALTSLWHSTTSLPSSFTLYLPNYCKGSSIKFIIGGFTWPVRIKMIETSCHPGLQSIQRTNESCRILTGPGRGSSSAFASATFQSPSHPNIRITIRPIPRICLRSATQNRIF